MTLTQSYDVVVIGGGPAGSAAATFLAKNGLKIGLFERARFPREHIGEGLIPSAVPVLESLGVKAELDARGYLRKRGTTFVWGADQEPWTVYFVEGNPSAGYSYQLHRPDFDHLMLNNAEKNGVDVHLECAVKDVIVDANRIVGVVAESANAERVVARAKYTIDASGQANVLGKFATKQWDPEIRNMALYGYFQGANRLEGIDATNTLVEGYEDGWFWAIPLHTGLLSVGTVMSSEEYKRLAAGCDWKTTLFNQIAKTRKVKELTSVGKLARGPYTMRDWSYNHDHFWGPGYALVGDAACFIDPLFSTGVFLGMQHAEILAACLTSVLVGEYDERTALSFYETEYKQEYDDLRNICLTMYAGAAGSMQSVFWNAKRILRLPDGVRGRSAFARLICGRERRGFEVSPLTRLQLPETVSKDLASYEFQLRSRLSLLSDDDLSGTQRRLLKEAREIPAGHRFWSVRLGKSAHAEVRDKLMVDGGRLKAGCVITTPLNPRGVAVEREFVSTVLPLVDGERTVREICSATPSHRQNEVSTRLASLYWFGVLDNGDATSIPEAIPDLIHFASPAMAASENYVTS